MKLFIIVLLVIQFKTLASNKVIYGKDDRHEVNPVEFPIISEWARSAATMIPNHQLINQENSALYKISGITLRKRYNVCKDERFVEQISPSYCSGFLFKKKWILTAGHCANPDYFSSYAWIFDFIKHNLWNDASTTSPDNIYYSKKIIKRVYGDIDYAIVELDREVKDRTPLPIRRLGKVRDDAELVAIGSPSGVPTKLTFGKIRKNQSSNIFVTNLDTFGGNSGSPVINVSTGEVEGIIVRGEEDYSYDPRSNCNRPKRCEENNCRGEDIVRTTVIEY